jgi:endonuclease G
VSRDTKIVPGIGIIGVMLVVALAGSLVVGTGEYLAWRRTVQVIAALQDGPKHLNGMEVYSEAAASDESKAVRVWKRTRAAGEAVFDLRPLQFYRFGVRMERQGSMQEAVFPARQIRDQPDRIEFDVRTISTEAWIPLNAQRPALNVIVGDAPPSPNLSPVARSTILKSRGLQIASPKPNFELREERAPFGVPDAPWIADRRGFTLGYDPQHRRPVFTAYVIDGASFVAVRRNPDVRFAPDPALPPEVQPRSEEFRGSGYDRGHLVRVSDIAPIPEADVEAHYMSAVVPQVRQSNQMTWLSIENYASSAAIANKEKIWIMTGPIYRRSAGEPEMVLALGESATPIPVSLFRILARRVGDAWQVQAFLARNDETVQRDPMMFVTSVRAIDTLVGRTLLPDLPAELRDAVDTKRWWEREQPSDTPRPPT